MMIMEELYNTLLYYAFSLLELLPRFERAPLPARTPADIFQFKIIVYYENQKI